MTGSGLSPNPLADLYDSLSIMLEALPAETHPAWELAVESVLFGGEGIAPETVSYGEQQANKNDFRMAAYRTRYGDGERVTEFPTLPTKPPREQDRQYVDEEIQLPVSPDSGTVLPLFVDDNTLPEAVGLLNEFPTEPGDETNDSSNSELLNANLFPGLTTSTSGQAATDVGRDIEQVSTQHADISPNELADLYDGFYTVLESLSNDTDPRWQEAIESILFGGAYLDSEASPYGKQQAERNEFGMPDYRSKYGDGNRVTDFPAIATKRPAGDDIQYVDDSVELPIAPNTQTVLPLRPAEGELPDAAQLLAEFPATPDAEAVKQGADADALFDIDAFLRDIDSGAQPNDEDSSTDLQPELASGSGETDGSNLKSRGASSSVASDLSRQEQERLVDIIDLAPTSNRELASCWGLDTTKEAWKFLSEHLDGYYQRNENDRIEPTETAIQICSSSMSELSQQERERLGDIIDLAPTSNGELASSWGLDTTKKVWEYLTEHLDDYYYRNENNRIEPTEEGIQISTQTNAKDSSIDSQPEWVPGSNQDDSPSRTDTATRSEESQSAATTETESGTDQDGSPSHTDTETRSEESQSAATSETEVETDGDNLESPSADSTVLRQESAGEDTVPLDQQRESDSDRSRKYDDPQAERAHRRAQQRDPSDVVELGEEITLTIKQVDYSSRPPTIMGTKNRLVVFVIDAPQDLSEYDTIKATVVDYGGKNNSAEAAFSGYVN